MSDNKFAPQTNAITDDTTESRVLNPLAALLERSIDPIFRTNLLAYESSTWHGHVPFAHWLVSVSKPSCIVELGTHNGVSYSAFCEGVKESHLGSHTTCYAVDTWEGDEQEGFYGKEVFEKIKLLNDVRYAEFSTLLKMEFSEALGRFADNSIELLHIDGRPTYEEVRNNFESWLPKISRERGIVLFHNIAARSMDFGVRQLWVELSDRYPNFSFNHSAGLGVLLIGSDLPDCIIGVVHLSDSDADRFRTRFEVLGQLAAMWAKSESPSAANHALDDLMSKAEAGQARLPHVLKRSAVETKALIRDISQLRENDDELRRTLEQDLQSRNAQRTELHQTRLLLRQRDQVISELHASASWRITAPFRRVVRSLKNQARRIQLLLDAAAGNSNSRDILNDFLMRRIRLKWLRFLPVILDNAFSSAKYAAWIEKFDTLSEDDERQIRRHIASGVLPEISVLVIAKKAWPETRKSIDNQLFNPRKVVYWDPSAPFETSTYNGECGDGDACIRGGADDVLKALEASPSITLIVEGGTVLSARCLYEVAAAAAASTSSCLIYADDDRRSSSGKRERPFFKPNFSPELLRWLNYIGSAAAIKDVSHLRQVIEEIAGGANVENALATYASELAREAVLHIPSILFHLAHMDMPTVRRAPELNDPVPLPSVSIIIPTRDSVDILRACVESILSSTDYPRHAMEILIVNNQSTSSETLRYLRKIKRENAVRIVPYPHAFNFSEICNAAAHVCNNSIIIFLNNDTTVNDALWVRKLVRYLALSDVGSVGSKLLYPDGSVQHGGTVVGIQGVAAHTLVGNQPDEGGYAGLGNATREMSAVTGACLAIRKEVFLEIGGFDPALAVTFNDVKLNIELIKAGYRVIGICDPLLIHHESKTRGYDDTPAKQARVRKEVSYTLLTGQNFFKNDPYYNPNLSLVVPYRLANPPRTVLPWRQHALRHGEPIRVLILSITHQIGHGVAVVANLQAEYLLKCGFEVFIGGPRNANEFDYPGCQRIVIEGPDEAARIAFELRIDCVIVYTSPFFSTLRWIGGSIRSIVVDCGEPNPEFFKDADLRRTIVSEKKLCAPMADRVIGVSEAVKAESDMVSMEVVRLGNSHLAVWNGQSDFRIKVRQKLGLEGAFVVLNVCRFHHAERNHKGVDQYELFAEEFKLGYPDLASNTVFLLCGKADPKDVEEMTGRGFVVKANVTDQEMAELYIAADCYASFSQWEGYNLGIGQAQAMGLHVFASDIPAHWEFNGVSVGTPESLSHDLARFIKVQTHDEGGSGRTPIIEGWDRPLQRFEAIIRETVFS
ncbi:MULTISPECIES: class I SAM-dependent methyltransferase [unclassified Rhizobium]|uniref:class I SAM-dependent methyltransferase n=1 Tax=unclassified Rhizobium TaxID=2613769 RepID=UPI00160AECA4|nr:MULTISPECIES: class I SAM-dependent methyltransferase [unclassified Rhizobium]MBB3291034.1 GT2 family glycosyltransferase [Rhizobium sp. BK252]MBB3405832.1 GT2 family glycosyltransferase [Rhizobium sp. BK289]MBB3418380.1 GT2 family glycosyltransferase [Rhizobium sp. BK284]MBB3486258.1 GT2 family glycosyltransferase [Rhizobium sp. BK347]